MAEPSKSVGGKNGEDVSFARTLGLFDASMIGIGAMIGAGIFVLTGIAAGVAGPGALLAFFLNGLVTLLTALAYAELASTYPKSGGGYVFIKTAFPGPVGFASGWMLWFCYIVACALYALGFGSYFWESLDSSLPALTEWAAGALGEHSVVVVVTLLIVLAFSLINIHGTAVSGSVENVLTVAKIIILAIFIFFGVRQMSAEPSQAMASFEPFLPLGFSGVLMAMGLTFIAFEGYDLIATVSEEIKHPERNIPRATMISLIVTVVIYLLIVIVCIGAIQPAEGASWEFLGVYQETAIVRAAEQFMPSFGVGLIIFGGLLSTLSALNASVLASSRVAFSMSRDKMLLRALSRIHPKRLTPHMAVAATGLVTAVLAVAFPIQVLGSAASLMFLLTFALVNLALIALRRKFPGEKQSTFRVPLYPLPPILAIVLNLGLAFYQYEFDPRAWYIAVAWLLMGLFVYFAYFEKKAAAEIPQVLEVGRPAAEAVKTYRILIPLAHPDHVEPLMKLAIPIAQANEGEIVALSVVTIPQNLPIHEGMRFIKQKQPLLKSARRLGREAKVHTRSALRIAHQAHDGILQAAESEGASLILMGWKGYTTTRDRILGEVADRVVHHAPCDLITIKLVEPFKFDRILLPTAGGPHATLAAEYVSNLRKAYGSKVTCCYVLAKGATDRDRQIADEWISKTVQRTALERVSEHKLIESDRIATSLIKAASEFDLLVMGASREGIFSSVLFGEIPEKVARFSESSVMIVRRFEGKTKTLIRKILG
ncbi:MAG TPA: amino acid permease [Acidobacteriota bacterium]|nr:amino acid permease [Acidobacteriota bacterium]